jgi:hypothetical protein
MLRHARVACIHVRDPWSRGSGCMLRVARQAAKDKEDLYLEFFREVVRRTAALVAAWQCVGFCHGARPPAASRASNRAGLLHANAMLSAAPAPVYVSFRAWWLAAR